MAYDVSGMPLPLAATDHFTRGMVLVLSAHMCEIL